MGAASISVEELVALVDVDPQQAPRRGARAASPTSPSPSDVAAQLWWITGLAQRELGDLVAPATASSRRASSPLAADDRVAGRPRDDQPGLRGRPRRRHPRRPRDCSTPSSADVGDADLAAAVDPARRPALPARSARRRRRRPRRRRTSWPRRPAIGSTELKALVNLGAIQSQRGRARRGPRAPAARRSRSPPSSTRSSWAALALANLAYVETVEGNLPEALDAFAAAEDGYRRAGHAGELPRLHANHAAGAGRRQPARRRRAADRPGRRAVGGQRQRPRASPSCCWCRPRSTSPRASPTRPHVERRRRRAQRSPPGPRQLAARRRAAAAAGRGPPRRPTTRRRRRARDERPGPRRRRLALGGAGVDAAGRPAPRRARPGRRRGAASLADVGAGRVARAGRPTASCSATSLALLAERRRRPGRGAAGGDAPGCGSPPRPRPRSARWRRGRTPPSTAPS